MHITFFILQRARYELYSVITSVAPIKDVERKLLLVPIIFMLMCLASFICDLYFYIHRGGLSERDSNNAGIIFVHFLIVSIKCTVHLYNLV